MGGGSGVDTDTGAGLHLLSLLVFGLSLAVVTWRAWAHFLRRNGRLPAPPVSRGLAAVYPLRWVYRCVLMGTHGTKREKNSSFSHV